MLIKMVSMATWCRDGGVLIPCGNVAINRHLGHPSPHRQCRIHRFCDNYDDDDWIFVIDVLFEMDLGCKHRALFDICA